MDKSRCSGHGVGPDGDERIEPKQRRRGPQDGEIRPLPLGLYAKMIANLLERGLDGPALNEPAKDLRRCGTEVGAQERLWIPHA